MDDRKGSFKNLYGEPLLTPKQNHQLSTSTSLPHSYTAIPPLRFTGRASKVSADASADETEGAGGLLGGSDETYLRDSSLTPLQNFRLRQDGTDRTDVWDSLDPNEQHVSDFNTSDPILQSWSKELYPMSSSFPELINASSLVTLAQGIKVISQFSWTSIIFTSFGSLPPFLAIVCLLLSGRPNAVEETAGFALGASMANLLMGVGLYLGAGMDLRSTEAVVDETWHLCWKLLSKCSCVSFWFFIVVFLPLIALEQFLNFPTSFFSQFLGEDVASIATSTLNIFCVGFLANIFFESFHRFLSYQSYSMSQVILVFATSSLHSVLLVSIVWRNAEGPEAAAILYSTFAAIRAFALALYVYFKKYELGWQSGVRVRLFQRERQSIGRGGRRRGMPLTQPSIDAPVIQKRRQKRIPTKRPGAGASEIMNALQSSGSFDIEGFRSSDSLHPDTAVAYAVQQDTEKLKIGEEESSFQSAPIDPLLQVNAQSNGATKTEIKTGNATQQSSLIPAIRDGNSILDLRRSYNASTSETAEFLSLLPTPDNTPRIADNNNNNEECDRVVPKKSAFKTPVKGKQRRDRSGGVGFHESTSLFNARRLSRKLANGYTLEEETESQPEGGSNIVLSGVQTIDLSEDRPTPAEAGRRKRPRQKTVVSVRSVSMDNYFVLDGWCLPTTLSWQTFWKVQHPRQLRETKEFLYLAVPTAVILSLEYLSFDVIIIIGSSLGPSSLSCLALVISLNSLLSSVPVAVASCISDQISFIVRLDNLPSAKALFKV